MQVKLQIPFEVAHARRGEQIEAENEGSLMLVIHVLILN